MARKRFLAAVLAVAAGCASSGTRPDDMSAAEHRRQADRHRTAARTHERAANLDPASESYARHEAQATGHASTANAHQAAAEELEQFQASECAAIDASTRAACPFHGNVAVVEDIAGGARVHLREGQPVNESLARMRCHVAFARVHGRAGMEGCPLYQPGVNVRLSPDGAAIDVTSDDPSAASEVQRRLRRHTAL